MRDSFDYGYYAYGLRHFGNMPLIEPLETREVRKIEDFVIAIDTSMSTSGELVRAFLSRTYELLQENTSFFRHFNLRILQCDDQLRSDKKVTNARELAEYMEHFELIGQSATDFRPVFEHVDRLNAEGAFRHLRACCTSRTDSASTEKTSKVKCGIRRCSKAKPIRIRCRPGEFGR